MKFNRREFLSTLCHWFKLLLLTFLTSNMNACTCIQRACQESIRAFPKLRDIVWSFLVSLEDLCGSEGCFWALILIDGTKMSSFFFNKDLLHPKLVVLTTCKHYLLFPNNSDIDAFHPFSVLYCYL